MLSGLNRPYWRSDADPAFSFLYPAKGHPLSELGSAASGHGVLGHGGVRPDQDLPAVSRKNQGASTKDGQPAAVGAEGRGDVTLHVQGRCRHTGSVAYRQFSRHPPRRWWKAAAGRSQWTWPCCRRSRVGGAVFRGRRRGVGPAWPEELGSDRPRQRESESEASYRR
jgi:hypothetical protein